MNEIGRFKGGKSGQFNLSMYFDELVYGDESVRHDRGVAGEERQRLRHGDALLRRTGRAWCLPCGSYANAADSPRW